MRPLPPPSVDAFTHFSSLGSMEGWNGDEIFLSGVISFLL